MKQLILVLVATATLAVSASAFTPRNSALNEAAPLKLVPRKVVNPTKLPLSFRGDVINVEFSLDAEGRPRNIQVTSPVEWAVRERIVKALSQWEFDPAAAADRTRFVLPLEVVLPRA